MVAAWRQAGMTYIQYSALCARLVRRALKPEFKEAAMKIEDTSVRITKWEGGKAVPKDAKTIQS